MFHSKISYRPTTSLSKVCKHFSYHFCHKFPTSMGDVLCNCFYWMVMSLLTLVQSLCPVSIAVCHTVDFTVHLSPLQYISQYTCLHCSMSHSTFHSTSVSIAVCHSTIQSTSVSIAVCHIVHFTVHLSPLQYVTVHFTVHISLWLCVIQYISQYICLHCSMSHSTLHSTPVSISVCQHSTFHYTPLSILI